MENVYLLFSCIVFLVIFFLVMLGLKSSTVEINRHDAASGDDQWWSFLQKPDKRQET